MFRAAAVILVSACVVLPAESLSAVAQKVIPRDHELAHAPVQLQFGPPGKHIIILHEPKGETNFSGIVLAGGKQYELVGPQEIPGHFEYQVESVLAANAGRGPERELVVLYSYHRNGSTSDDGTACLVYHWDGKEFQVLKAVSAKLAGAKNAGEVRARLRTDSGSAKRFRLKSDSKGMEK
jgi:hypothetical protein